jgi:hypothetical protein
MTPEARWHAACSSTVSRSGVAAKRRKEEFEWNVACATDDSPKVSATCNFGGVTYSTGSASCQSGTQYRCEDGRWASLGITCPVGDSPIRIVPSGKTCMFDSATVANNSTICRSGTTYLCSDGEWVNVGTQCR